MAELTDFGKSKGDTDFVVYNFDNKLRLDYIIVAIINYLPDQWDPACCNLSLARVSKKMGGSRLVYWVGSKHMIYHW